MKETSGNSAVHFVCWGLIILFSTWNKLQGCHIPFGVRCLFILNERSSLVFSNWSLNCGTDSEQALTKAIHCFPWWSFYRMKDNTCRQLTDLHIPEYFWSSTGHYLHQNSLDVEDFDLTLENKTGWIRCFFSRLARSEWSLYHEDFSDSLCPWTGCPPAKYMKAWTGMLIIHISLGYSRTTTCMTYQLKEVQRAVYNGSCWHRSKDANIFRR